MANVEGMEELPLRAAVCHCDRSLTGHLKSHPNYLRLRLPQDCLGGHSCFDAMNMLT